MKNGDAQLDRRYFFDDGLRFECAQCGKCCTGAPGSVRLSEKEILQLAELFGISRAAFARDFTRKIEPADAPENSFGSSIVSLIEREDGSCIFLKDGKCGVHSLRPAQCRTFPFWTKNLRTEDSWQRTGLECPGIGSGPVWVRDEILRTVGESPI
jgi:uncharacterized protein